MALEQKLSLKLSQRLVMTPSLQQAIKLLQMNRIELETEITQELEENPVPEENEVVAEEEPREEKAEEPEPMSDIDLEAFFGDHAESWEGKGNSSVYEERQAPPLENTLAQEDDLYDHLSWQLHMMSVSPLIREIAELIIGNLDPDGFLVATIDEIQAMGADGFEEDAEEREAAIAAYLETVQKRLHDESAAEAEEAAEAEGDDANTAAVGEDLGAVGDAASATSSVMTGLGESSGADSAQSVSTESVSTLSANMPTANNLGAGSETVEEGTVSSASESFATGQQPGDGESLEEAGSVELPEGSYPYEAVAEALMLVRSLEPQGIACFDLRDSLQSQLDLLNEPEDSLTRRLVTEKWDLFKRRKFEQIAKDFSVPLKQLKPVVEMISKLETRPGRRFNTERTLYVEPDVHVVKVGDDYVIQINDNGLPRLRVSRSYRDMLRAMRKKGGEAEAQAYIKEKMRSAMWLIKSLDQRQRTIYKVATSIVKQQRGFLDHGVEHLRPMVLRDVAEDIEMHESTVSRVVSNKYIHTPRGLLPMKFFFHSGIDREYGGDISSLSVKRKIKNLVSEENPKKPLSDSELMRILKREGIQIARRTVAKYRDELNIPSSTERKQIF